MALAIAIAGLLIAAPTATAKVYKFRVLSASETNTMTATKGCLSGKRSFSSSTSTPSEDPDSSYNTDDGYGSIGTTATSASFHDDEMSNSCSMPPCHYDYGTRQLQDKSIGVFVEEIPGSADLKVSAGIFGLEVGSIEGPCGDISVNWPSEPFVNVPKAELFSGEPVQITISGEQPFTQDILGNPITASVSYTNKMTVQALGKKLKADPGGPYTVRRAGKVTLDGSRSKPRAAIRDYIWKFDSVGQRLRRRLHRAGRPQRGPADQGGGVVRFEGDPDRGWRATASVTRPAPTSRSCPVARGGGGRPSITARRPATHERRMIPRRGSRQARTRSPFPSTAR